MRVKFTTNLGSREAAEEALQLDWTECKCGDELEVGEKAGEILLKRNRVVVVNRKRAKQPIHAVPEEPAIKAEPTEEKTSKTAGKAAEIKPLPPVHKGNK